MRGARREAGLSQYALAAASGVREQVISRLGRGDRDPRLSAMVGLAQGLGTTPAELVTRMGQD